MPIPADGVQSLNDKHRAVLATIAMHADQPMISRLEVSLRRRFVEALTPAEWETHKAASALMLEAAAADGLVEPVDGYWFRVLPLGRLLPLADRSSGSPSSWDRLVERVRRGAEPC